MITSGSARKESAGPANPPPSESNSLVLDKLAGSLADDRKFRILDLGPAVGSTIAFFGQFRCMLQIEDLYRTVTSEMLEWWDDPSWIENRMAELLHHDELTPFDVILTWDLFNYLGPDALSALRHHLRRISRPGTLLFSLIYTLPTMPSVPARFEIVDRQRIRYQASSNKTRPSPRYTQVQLRRLLPDLKTKHSFLLRNGTQEYLLAVS